MVHNIILYVRLDYSIVHSAAKKRFVTFPNTVSWIFYLLEHVRSGSINIIRRPTDNSSSAWCDQYAY